MSNKRTFSDLSNEELLKILNIALDNGNWHTTTASDIQLSELSSNVVAYGTCKISLHNTFRDKEVWFNINENTVQIWESRPRGRMYPESIHMAIYNLNDIVSTIENLLYDKTEQHQTEPKQSAHYTQREV